MSTNFLTRSRHKSIYYFRRRIPLDLKQHFSNDLLLKSLHTSNKKIAVILARNLASQTDDLFEKIRQMNKNTTGDFMAGFILKLNLDKDKQPVSIDVDAQPHEAEAVSAILASVMSSDATNKVTALQGSYQQPFKDFQSSIEEYLQKAELKASTIANYKSKLQFAKEYYGENFNVLSVTQIKIVEFSEHVKSHIENVTTQGQYIQIVLKFFNWHGIRNVNRH